MQTDLQNIVEGDLDRLVYNEFFSHRGTGVIVDVGAGRPDFLSISRFYRDVGWRVIAIEPNPMFCARYRASGFDILEYACGDHDADNVPFTIVATDGVYLGGQVSNESFSSLGVRDKYAELMKTTPTKSNQISVRLRRLDRILTEQAPPISRIDILSIDVEGWELEVLEGINLRKYKPKVLIIENLFNEERYREYMRCNQYDLLMVSPPNDLYVRRTLLSPLLLPLRRRRKAFRGATPSARVSQAAP